MIHSTWTTLGRKGKTPPKCVHCGGSGCDCSRKIRDTYVEQGKAPGPLGGWNG